MRKLHYSLRVGAFILLLCPFVSHAQNAKLRKADQMMEALHYEDAIAVFGKIANQEDAPVSAILGLAEAYKKTGRLDEAERWYARALLHRDVPPEVHFVYGQIVLQKGDCAGAQLAFREFLRRKPYDSRRNELEQVCEKYQQMLHGENKDVVVELPDFNGQGSDIGPAFYGDGLVFGSVREDKTRGAAFYDLYYTTNATDAESLVEGKSKYQPAELFSEQLTSTVNEAIVTFSPDHQEVYFTRNQAVPSSEKFPLRRLEIMVSRKGSDGSWSTPEPLAINNSAYSNAHPALSPDGHKLFFTSDRPGGFGGKDIYVCERIGRVWGSPVNLGPGINTEGDELFPYYHSLGVLYFSSDGHLGLGGQDIFYVEDIGGGAWGEVQNMGAPINSTADDFGFIIKNNQKQGYFASNRSGGVGLDDIYAFKTRQIWLNIRFMDTAGQPLASEVELFFPESGQTTTVLPGAHWSAWVPYNTCLDVEASGTGIAPRLRQFCMAAAADADTLLVDWEISLLLSDDSGQAVSTTSIDKTIDLLIFNQLTGKPVSNAVVEIKHRDSQQIDKLTTNTEGVCAVQVRASSCVDIMIAAEGYYRQPWSGAICGNADLPKLLTMYLAPTEFTDTAARVNDMVAKQGRENTFAVSSTSATGSAVSYTLKVYYDPGRSSVRAESISDLGRLYWLLVNNPEIAIEVSSHTDANGAADFNKKLSQRRADAIVGWLISKGISAKRLKAVGYGESSPVNQCTDGIICSEQEHQANRRTEFKVLVPQYGQTQ